eukprot:336724-Hanusia_phi.AAC.1
MRREREKIQVDRHVRKIRSLKCIADCFAKKISIGYLDKQRRGEKSTLLLERQYKNDRHERTRITKSTEEDGHNKQHQDVQNNFKVKGIQPEGKNANRQAQHICKGNAPASESNSSPSPLPSSHREERRGE